MNAAKSAYAGAVLFAALLALTITVGSQQSTALVIAMGVIGAAAHLVLMPVVGAMNAPDWARAAGYGWLVVDTMVTVATLNGLPPGIAGPLTLGSHASSALWMASVARNARGPVTAIGWPLAIYLAFHAFATPWLPAWSLYPSFATIPIWLVFIGRSLQPRSA